MTAEQFRRRRLAERKGEAGLRNMAKAISAGLFTQPADILRDMGTGDMFGTSGDVWTPPVANGYRCEAIQRSRGRINAHRLAQSRFQIERRWEDFY